MSKPYKYRQLTNKESFDIDTMRYFIPRQNAGEFRISHNDKIKMADLSSRGIKPKRITTGFDRLQWGKTYRDEQITAYRRDIQLGYITKGEILDCLPERFKDWMWSKIKDVPYDTEGRSTAMWVDMYRRNDV